MFALSLGDDGFVQDSTPERLEAPTQLQNKGLFHQFGSALALSDDTLVVGSSSLDDSDDLPVYIYTFKPLLGTWGPNPTQMIKRITKNAYMGFGCSLNIAGNHMVIGDMGDFVTFYRRDGPGEDYDFAASIAGSPGTGFAQSVTLSEKYCFIGFRRQNHIYKKMDDGGYGESYYHWLVYESPRGSAARTYGLGAAAITNNYFMVADAGVGEVYLYEIDHDVASYGYGGLPIATYRDDYAASFGIDVALIDNYAVIGTQFPGWALIYPNLVRTTPCTAGYGLFRGNATSGTCQLCAPGTFSAGGGDSYEECAVNEFSNAVSYTGAHTCNACPYGRVSACIGSGADLSNDDSYTDGMDKCTGRDHDCFDYAADESLECECSFYGYAGGGVALEVFIIVLVGTLVSATLGCMWYLVKYVEVDSGHVNRVWLVAQLMQLTLLPVLDVVSDVLYLLLAVWATEGMFVLGNLTLILPLLVFLDGLYRVQWYPKFWLGAPPPRAYVFEDLDSLWKVSVTLLTTLPWVLLNLPLLLVFIVVGYLLYSVKLLAIRPVRNFWVQLWTGTDKFDIVEPVDLTILNESLYAELWVETIPQLILQCVNNTLMQSWSTITLFFTSVSILIILNCLYRVWYFVYQQGFSTEAIPTGLEWYVKLQGPHTAEAATGVGVLGILRTKLGMDKVKELEEKIDEIVVELSTSQKELSKKDLELQRANHILSADSPGYVSHATNPVHVLAAEAKAGRPLDASAVSQLVDSDDEGHDGSEVDDTTNPIHVLAAKAKADPSLDASTVSEPVNSDDEGRDDVVNDNSS